MSPGWASSSSGAVSYGHDVERAMLSRKSQGLRNGLVLEGADDNRAQAQRLSLKVDVLGRVAYLHVDVARRPGPAPLGDALVLRRDHQGKRRLGEERLAHGQA